MKSANIIDCIRIGYTAAVTATAVNKLSIEEDVSLNVETFIKYNNNHTIQKIIN